MKPVQLHWRSAVVLTTLCCRACFLEGKRHPELPAFSVLLCERMGRWPVDATPHWWNYMRGMVRQHYKAEHPGFSIR